MHHLAAEHARQSGRHLCAGEVFTGNANGAAGEFLAPPEDAVRATADVLGRDAGQRPTAHRQREIQLAVGPGFGPMPKWIRLSQ